MSVFATSCSGLMVPSLARSTRPLANPIRWACTFMVGQQHLPLPPVQCDRHWNRSVNGGRHLCFDGLQQPFEDWRPRL
eukprot:g15769.t1